MSWLQNLAKKGENFLDQLDQQAGAAIEQAETKIQKLKESAHMYWSYCVVVFRTFSIPICNSQSLQ